MKILYLEDDQQQALLIDQWLTDKGHEVSWVENANRFLVEVSQSKFDMAILDWELPESSGLDVLKQLRQSNDYELPVIFTTQRDSEEDIVEALNAGADDYLTKPLREAELNARLEALARRSGIEADQQSLTLGHIRIDKPGRRVYVNDEEVKVTPKDYELAVQLLSNVGRILSREYLLRTVWGVDAELNTRTVDVHISRVRRSLNINPDTGYFIRTIYQHGYRLEKITE